MLRFFQRLYIFLRISTLGFTLLLPLLGAASTRRVLPFPQNAFLIAVAFAFHVFAYVLNDVMDLWLDRTEPLRADSLLVRSEVDRRRALWLAWLQVPIAFALASYASASRAALVSLGLAFLALTIYDVYGKRCPWPLLTDAVQALGWCALALFGALFEVSVLWIETVWLIAYVFVYVIMVNAIHGSLRDIANDFARGARTTAIWMGARPGANGQIHLSPTLIVYGIVLQGALVGFALLALDAVGYRSSAILPVLTIVASSALLPASFAFRRDRRRLLAFGAWHIVATLSVLPFLYLPVLNVSGIVTLLAVFLLPCIAMFRYNGSHWCV